MQSSGGITTAERASREPVRTILSGPAGGVVASAMLAERLGIRRAISFDMGGTSTDVCLLDGPPRVTRETTLAGLPIAVPVLDVHSVGAGGGSIARVDAGGALRVGPESAGAVPGPICYHKGGTRPTVTDAHLILGRLVPEYFLGGTFRLESHEVKRSFQRFIRSVPGSLRPMLPETPQSLAHGMIAVANATMGRALRLISVERGHDPRDFTLVCFGGAGGLHAADLARSLGMAGVIVPLHPGAFSALGILVADVVKDVSQSVLMAVPTNPQDENKSRPQFESFLRELTKGFEKLERRGLDELRREHHEVSSVKIDRGLAVRYAGQSYEISIPFTRSFPRRFHQEHELAYGHAQPSHSMEVVSLQVRLILPTPTANLKRPHPGRSLNLRGALLKRNPVWFEGRPRPTPIYDRERIPVGVKFSGPAILVEYSSTTVVPPDFACHVDEHLNLRLTPHAS